MADPDTEGIKDDFQDTLDISKLLSGSIEQSGGALEGVTDKCNEINEALKDSDVYIDGLTIDPTTFSSMQSILKDSGTHIQSAQKFASDLTTEMKSAADAAGDGASAATEGEKNAAAQAVIVQNVTCFIFH